MAKDTRVSQLQSKQLVISGSDAFIIYPVDKQSSTAPNQGIVDSSKFPTGSIGQDVLFFVSGAIDGKGGSVRAISAFGGDLHISGNLTVDGTTIINDTMNYFYSDQNGVAKSSGSLHVSGVIQAAGGFSGSLTKLIDGTPYIIGGENITVITNSNGSITFTASPGFFFSDTNSIVETSGSIEVSGSGLFKSGLTGALNVLPDGQPFLKGAASNVIFSTASNGQIILSVLTGSVGAPGGTGELAFNDGTNILTGSSNFWVDDGVSLNVSGVIKASVGFSGSLTSLLDGSPYITTIGGVSIVTQSNGSLQISGTQGISEHSALSGLGDDDHTQYLRTDGTRTLTGNQSFGGFNITNVGDLKATSLTGSLTQIAPGVPYITTIGGISIVTQSNGSLQLSASQVISDHGSLTGLSDDDHTQYTLADGTRAFTGDISHGGNNITNVGNLEATSLTGSLTQVAPGIPYITTIGGISIVTQSNGSLQLSGSEGITNHGELTGLSNDDHIQYVLVDGTRNFTGIVTAPGFSGSLTKLSNGDDYLKAGTAITLSTGSDGSITISATPGATLAGGGEGQIQYNVGGALTASNNFWIDPGTKVNVTGAVEASLGFTGSLTRTVAGTPAFVTINGLSISTGSFGQVTISGNPMSASIAEDINNLQNDVASAGFGLWYSITNNLTENSASIAVSGSIKAKSGITGALNVLPDNSPFIVTSDGLSVSTGSNGQITVSGQPLSGAVQSHINDTTIHFTEASIDHGSISGLSDDDHLQYIRVDGTRAFTGNQSFGNNQITNVSTITATTGTFNKVNAADLVQIGSAWDISNETKGGVERLALKGVGANDPAELLLQSKGSANKARLTLSPDNNTSNYAGMELDVSSPKNSLNMISVGSQGVRPFELAITGSAIMRLDTNGAITFKTGSVTVEKSLFASHITGSLTRISAGVPFIVTSDGLSVSTGSNGQVVISGNPMSASIAQEINDLQSAQAGAAAWYEVNNVLVATTSSVQTSGSLLVKSGITGALNKLPDNSDFLAGANGITTSTGSNGQVTLNFKENLFFNSVRTVTGSSLTLANSDNNSLIYVSNSAGTDVTIPNTLSNNFQCSFVQATEGRIVFDSTNIISLPSGFKSASFDRNSQVLLVVSSSVNYLFGDLEPQEVVSTHIVDASGDRTVTDSDNGKIIFMSGSSTNFLRFPNNISDGFSATYWQASSAQLIVFATASLNFASTTFVSAAAEFGSAIVVASSSAGLFLAGDLEPV